MHCLVPCVTCTGTMNFALLTWKLRKQKAIRTIGSKLTRGNQNGILQSTLHKFPQRKDTTVLRAFSKLQDRLFQNLMPGSSLRNKSTQGSLIISTFLFKFEQTVCTKQCGNLHPRPQQMNSPFCLFTVPLTGPPKCSTHRDSTLQRNGLTDQHRCTTMVNHERHHGEIRYQGKTEDIVPFNRL